MNPVQENYLDYLPDIFRNFPGMNREDRKVTEQFLDIFRNQFEQIEDKIERFPEIVLDPATADESFLPYLASWIALALPESWSVEKKRKLTSRIMGIYQARGRKMALKTFLDIYLDEGRVQAISENPDKPHTFTITVNFSQNKPVEMLEVLDSIRSVIDKEKPAHTYFFWDILTPTMQICGLKEDEDGKKWIKGHSQVGVDTILGTKTNGPVML